jgi:hypothetical protein
MLIITLDYGSKSSFFGIKLVNEATFINNQLRDSDLT